MNFVWQSDTLWFMAGLLASVLPSPTKQKDSIWAQGGQYTYWGIFMVVATAMGFGGGLLLDRRFHTKPWLSLAGAILGIAAGFREFLMLARKVWKEIDSESSKQGAVEEEKEKEPA